MPTLIILILLLVTALGCLLASYGAEGENRVLLRMGGGALVVVLALTAFFTSVTVVPANSVAIVTRFGAQTGTLSGGAHLIPPWSSTVEFTRRVQTIHRANGHDGDDRVKIRFAGGGSGWANTTLRAQVQRDNIVALWRNYGTTDAAFDKIVDPETNNAFQAVYGLYAPEDAINGEHFAKIADAVVTDLNRRLTGYGIKVVGLSISGVDLDGPVQDRINALIAAQAQTRVATQQLTTAQKEAAANRAAQSALTPQTLANKCLDITAEAARSGKPLPAAWSCLGGSIPSTIAVK